MSTLQPLDSTTTLTVLYKCLKVYSLQNRIGLTKLLLLLVLNDHREGCRLMDLDSLRLASDKHNLMGRLKELKDINLIDRMGVGINCRWFITAKGELIAAGWPTYLSLYFANH